MKLTEKEIDSIINNASQCIYDDLWSKLDTEWIKNYLSSSTINEYDKEDLNEILKRLKAIQKEMQKESILYREISYFIEDMDIHLSPINIGKVLTKLANDYLDE